MAVPRTQHDAPGPELEPLQRSPGWTQVAGSPSALWCLPDPKALEEPDKPWRRASCGHTGLGPPLGVTGADLQPRLSPPVCTWRLPLIPGDRAPTACPPRAHHVPSGWPRVRLAGRPRERRASREAGGTRRRNSGSTGAALFNPELPALDKHKPTGGLSQRGSFRGNPRKTWGRMPDLFICMSVQECAHALVCVCPPVSLPWSAPPLGCFPPLGVPHRPLLLLPEGQGCQGVFRSLPSPPSSQLPRRQNPIGPESANHLWTGRGNSCVGGGGRGSGEE